MCLQGVWKQHTEFFGGNLLPSRTGQKGKKGVGERRQMENENSFVFQILILEHGDSLSSSWESSLPYHIDHGVEMTNCGSTLNQRKTMPSYVAVHSEGCLCSGGGALPSAGWPSDLDPSWALLGFSFSQVHVWSFRRKTVYKGLSFTKISLKHLNVACEL